MADPSGVVGQKVTIPKGASDSLPVSLSFRALKWIVTDAAAEGDRLAVLIGAGPDGPFGLARDRTGNVIVLAFAPGDAVELDRDRFEGTAWFKLRTVLMAVVNGLPQPQAQSADRTFWVMGVG
jgi:hypothetical protein